MLAWPQRCVDQSRPEGAPRSGRRSGRVRAPAAPVVGGSTHGQCTRPRRWHRAAAHGWHSRIDHARARAEEAAARYRELARRDPVYALPIVAADDLRGPPGHAAGQCDRLPHLPLVDAARAARCGPAHRLGRSFPLLAERAQSTTGVAAVARQQVVAALEDGGQSWWVAVVIGLFGFLWTTRTLMRNLIQATAHIWDAPTRRQPQRQVIISSLVFAGAWLALFFASGLVSALDVVPVGLAAAFAIQITLSSRGVARDLAPAARPASVVDGPPARLPPLRARPLPHAPRRAASTCQPASSTRHSSTARSASLPSSSCGCSCSAT